MPRRYFPILFLLLICGSLLIRPGALSREGNVLGNEWAADLTLKYLPWKAFATDSYLRGEAPLWNPYILCGEPLACEVETAAFYPLNVLFLLLPLVPAYNLCLVGHIFLAGLFTYWFVRYLRSSRAAALVSAITFMLSAPFFARIYAGHFPLICTMAWFPLILLGLEAFLRKRTAGRACTAGFAWAMQILAGHPQYAFYSLIGAFLYFFFRATQVLLADRRGSRLSTASALGGGFLLFCGGALVVSAIQWLPMLTFIPLSARGRLPYDFVASYSLPPESLLMLFTPGIFGDMLRLPYWGSYNPWEMCAYVGILPLLLAVAALCSRRDTYTPVMAVLAAISIILALGGNTPLFPVLYAFVPGFSFFRGASKFLFLAVFYLAVLAGLGTDVLLKPLKGWTRSLRLLFASVALACAFLFIATYFIPDSALALCRTFFGNRPVELSSLRTPALELPALSLRIYHARLQAMSFFGIATTASGCCLLVLKFERVSRAGGLLLAAFLLFDPGLFIARYAEVCPIRSSRWNRAVSRFLREREEPFRVLSLSPIRFSLNGGMYEGIANMAGCSTNVLERIHELSNFVSRGGARGLSQVVLFDFRPPLPGILNARYFLADDAAAKDLFPMKVLYSAGENRVLLNKGALPRAFIVGHTRLTKRRDRVLAELFSPSFDPLRTVILEEAHHAIPGGEKLSPEGRSVRFVRYTPREIVLETNVTPPGGYLVLSDTHYPGWRVYVDGRRERIFRANYIMRAVYLENGRHTVRFVYRPPGFYVALAISLAGVITACAVLARHCSQRSRRCREERA